MKTISMLDFRHHAQKVLAQVQKGERIILTHRGKPVARLEPITSKAVNADDPFYSLAELAEAGDGPLSNAQIDDILYGK